MTEKELEKLFKSKLDNREFTFNPENWQRMEAILDEKSGARGGYFWRSAAAILLFGAIVGSLIYFNPGMESTAPAEHIAAPSNAEQKNAEETNPRTTTSAGSENTSEPNTPTNNVQAPGGTHVIADSPAKEEKKPVEEIASGNETWTNTTSGPAEIASAPSTESSDNKAPTFEPVTQMELLALGYKGYRPLAVNTPELEARLPDLSSSAPQAAASRVNPRNFFVNAGPVFTGSNTGNNLGTGVQAGLGYRYLLPYGFSVETGLNYVVQNDLDIRNSSDSTFYNFGKERVETEEKTHHLEYIELPLNVSYQFASKHEVGIGAYMSVLVNVERDVQRTRYTPKFGTTTEAIQESGYQEEFNRYDYGFGIFYRYSINPRFRVGLHLKQGLQDITLDVSKGYAMDHRNFNSRIVLEYSLF